MIFNFSIRSQIFECKKIVFNLDSVESLDLNYQSYSRLKIWEIKENHREFYKRFNPNAESLSFSYSNLPDEIPNSESVKELDIFQCEWFNNVKIGNAWNMPELKSLRVTWVYNRNLTKVRKVF